MKISTLLLLASLAACRLAAAETWGQPYITETQLGLDSTGEVSLEIIAGQVEKEAGKNFTGMIQLEWADPRFSASAQQLRHLLIARGIAPQKVKLIASSGGYQQLAIRGVAISVRHILLRLPECDDVAKGYRFNIHDEQGCALNNALSSALVNPDKHYF